MTDEQTDKQTGESVNAHGQQANRMTLEAFQALLDTCGASPERWPGEAASAAQSLLAASEEARRIQEDARALEVLLDRATPEPASADLSRRILSTAPAPRALHILSQFMVRKPWGYLWDEGRGETMRAGSLAACAVFGIYLGASGLVPLASFFEPEPLAAITGGDIFLDLVLGGFEQVVD